MGHTVRDRGYGGESCYTPNLTLESLLDEVMFIPACEQIRLYNEGLYMRSPPVPGAKEGLLTLKRMGYKWVVLSSFLAYPTRQQLTSSV